MVECRRVISTSHMRLFPKGSELPLLIRNLLILLAAKYTRQHERENIKENRERHVIIYVS